MKDTANKSSAAGTAKARIFLDTNILLDYLYFRSEEALAVEYVFDACLHGTVDCFIAVHSLTNLFYIIRKDFVISDKKQIVRNLCAICHVQEVSEQTIERALDSGYSDDLEDALQMQCATDCGADMMLTRDLSGFEKSPVRVVLPHDLIRELKL